MLGVGHEPVQATEETTFLSIRLPIYPYGSTRRYLWALLAPTELVSFLTVPEKVRLDP